jgi:hypothetical protein
MTSTSRQPRDGATGQFQKTGRATAPLFVRISVDLLARLRHEAVTRKVGLATLVEQVIVEVLQDAFDDAPKAQASIATAVPGKGGVRFKF